jgi:hypothetical protein
VLSVSEGSVLAVSVSVSSVLTVSVLTVSVPVVLFGVVIAALQAFLLLKKSEISRKQMH